MILFRFSLLCTLALLLLGAVPIPDPSADLGGFLGVLATLWGQWWLFGAAFAVGTTKLLRAHGVRWIPWLGTRIGGVVLAFVLASIGTAGSALLDGVAPGLPILGQSILAGLIAIGTHSAAKNLSQGNDPKPVEAGA